MNLTDFRNAKFSYGYRPPDLAGYRVIEVAPHARMGAKPIERHWYYCKTDASGMLYRAKGAAKRMRRDGVTSTSPPVHILPAKPTWVRTHGVAGTILVKDTILDQYWNPNPPPPIPALLPGEVEPVRRRRKRRSFKNADTQIVGDKAAVRTASYVNGSAIWVPVVGINDATSGWVDIGSGRYVAQSAVPPEGLGGQVRRDATLRYTPSFAETLKQLKS